MKDAFETEDRFVFVQFSGPQYYGMLIARKGEVAVEMVSAPFSLNDLVDRMLAGDVNRAYVGSRCLKWFLRRDCGIPGEFGYFLGASGQFGADISLTWRAPKIEAAIECFEEIARGIVLNQNILLIELESLIEEWVA